MGDKISIQYDAFRFHYQALFVGGPGSSYRLPGFAWDLPVWVPAGLFDLGLIEGCA